MANAENIFPCIDFNTSPEQCVVARMGGSILSGMGFMDDGTEPDPVSLKEAAQLAESLPEEFPGMEVATAIRERDFAVLACARNRMETRRDICPFYCDGIKDRLKKQVI